MTKSTITDERVTSVIERLEHYACNLKWTNVRGAQDLLTATDGLRELQERRKPLQDKDLQGVIDALEHPAGINAAGKQVVRHALVELQERRKAAMDSEPVAWTWHYREQWHVTNDKCRAEFVAKDGDVDVLPLYRHAQHPEVPPEMTSGKAVHHWSGGHGAIESFVAGCNFYRAAMLASSTQSPGSEPATVPSKWIPVSERMPDCWCRTCRPVDINDMRFVVCPDCGNKRCPRANDHRNACTGSNEPGQEGSAYPDTQREGK
ncbi:hypothetical protein [Klebsiella sp. P1CD1]|uniref:hypothetical protein n=1 Tax=Klebsiella sp. P1CD1 TaxID=2267618 RepID=UPI001D0D84AA|nr:hypothetical protein [Klebsiella sp. P1CD1]